MDFLKYLNAVRKHWWPLMSCALFTLLGMWIFYANKNNAWALRSTFGIAGLCLFWAGYRAWLDEYKKIEQLQVKSVPAQSPKEKFRDLSTSILQFIYERAWRQSPWDCIHFYRSTERKPLEDYMRSINETSALMIYEKNYSSHV